VFLGVQAQPPLLAGKLFAPVASPVRPPDILPDLIRLHFEKEEPQS
jgi:hypothetical protein